MKLFKNIGAKRRERNRIRNLLRAWAFRLPSGERKCEEGTTFAGPQVYPGPGPSRVKFFGSFRVLFEVPDSPTEI